MSWKGLQKGVTRAPQSFRQRMNIGAITKDAVYTDAQQRFTSIETQTKKLHEESNRYWKAIRGMLDHQIEFSKAIEEIYKPISGRASDPNSTKPEGNPEGIEACKQYREVVQELQMLLKPELELIESKILMPADELLGVIKSIQKMLTKRDHKQLDLDRHLSSLKKLQDKKERNAKEEEKLYKAENNVEIAQQEFNYYNDLLKDELPRLFAMEADFIKPLFQSFYYMQLNIFYTLFTRMEEMKIPYFDMDSPIIEHFMAKRGDIKEQCEQIGITHFRVGHAKTKLEMTKKRFQKPGEAAAENSDAALAPPAYAQPEGQAQGYAQPQYTSQYPVEKHEYAAPAAAPVATQYAAPVATQYAAPVAPVAPAAPVAAPAVEYCTALYDYTAQAAGDLSFSTGDKIQVLDRSDAAGWWTGVLNGQQGIFPGNYVQL